MAENMRTREQHAAGDPRPDPTWSYPKDKHQEPAPPAPLRATVRCWSYSRCTCSLPGKLSQPFPSLPSSQPHATDKRARRCISKCHLITQKRKEGGGWKKHPAKGKSLPFFCRCLKMLASSDNSSIWWQWSVPGALPSAVPSALGTASSSSSSAHRSRSLHPQERRFPQPRNQSPAPNPGLISGIQATDELRTRGPAPQGSGGHGHHAAPRLGHCERGHQPQLPHKTPQGEVNHAGIQQLLGKSEFRKAAGFGGSRSCQRLTLT